MSCMQCTAHKTYINFITERTKRKEMSKSIFELSQDFEGILELALDDTMDLDALEEGLKSIEGDMTDKCKNGIGLIRELEARRDAMKAESKRLTANARTLDNKLNRIKKIYVEGLQAFGKSRIDTTIGRMSIQKNPPALKVTVPEGIPYKGNIPDAYLDVIPEHYELDKAAIKDALKQGEEVPYCHLESGVSLRIK